MAIVLTTRCMQYCVRCHAPFRLNFKVTCVRGAASEALGIKWSASICRAASLSLPNFRLWLATRRLLLPSPHPRSLPASPPPLAIHHPITTHCVEHSLPKSLPSSAPAPSSRSGKQPPPLLLHPLPTPPSHLPPPKERRSATWPRARSLLGKSTLSSSVKDNPAEVMSKPSHDLSLPLHHHRPWPHWRRTQRPPSPSTVAAVS